MVTLSDVAETLRMVHFDFNLDEATCGAKT